MDLDLGTGMDDGLVVIRELGLGARSTLVTSYYDKDEVQATCAELGLKIVPKPLAAMAV